MNVKSAATPMKLSGLKEGADYNDFGYRYCPFCGAMFDTIIIDKKP